MRELISQLTDQEIIEFTLTRVLDVVPPVDLFLEGSSCTSDIFQKLVSFRKQICLRFPQLNTFFYSSLSPSNQNPKETLIDMVLQKKSNCCQWLLEIEDDSCKGITDAHVF